MSLTLLVRTRAQFSATKKSLRLAVVHSLAPGPGWSVVCVDKRFRHSAGELRSTEALWEDRAPGQFESRKMAPGNRQANEHYGAPRTPVRVVSFMNCPPGEALVPDCLPGRLASRTFVAAEPTRRSVGCVGCISRANVSERSAGKR